MHKRLIECPAAWGEGLCAGCADCRHGGGGRQYECPLCGTRWPSLLAEKAHEDLCAEDDIRPARRPAKEW